MTFGPARPRPGPAGQKQVAGDFRGAFPDLAMTVELMLAEADLVAARWTMEGTNTAQWGQVPPTSNHVRFSVGRGSPNHIDDQLRQERAMNITEGAFN